MKKLHSLAMAVCLIGGLSMAIGCDGGTIQISHFRPASVDIPARIHRVAVAEFDSGNRSDGRYGEIASDKLASDLDAYNRKYSRYELVDRKNLKRILDEKDWQRAINDTSAASDAGKIAKVDAIIYGSVKVRGEAVHATKTVPDPVEGNPYRTKTVPYIKHVVTVVVTFTMDDITTSKPLATKTITANYDSDKDKDNTSMMAMFGGGSDDKKSLEEAANVLIDQCVQQFVSMISPHDVKFYVKLAVGKTKAVARGNKFAVTGDYEEALNSYKEGLAEKSEDDGAVYNCGLVCEASGQYKEAGEYYAKAIRMNSGNKMYFEARQRVRSVTGANGDGDTDKPAPMKTPKSKGKAAAVIDG